MSNESPLPIETYIEPGGTIVVRFISCDGHEFTRELSSLNCNIGQAESLIQSIKNHIASVTTTVVFHTYIWAFSVDKLKELRQDMVYCFSNSQPDNSFCLFEYLLAFSHQVSTNESFSELHNLLLYLFRQYYFYLSSVGSSCYPQIEHSLLCISSQYAEIISAENNIANTKLRKSLLLQFPSAGFEFILENDELYYKFLNSTRIQTALKSMYHTLSSPCHTNSVLEKQTVSISEILPEVTISIVPFILLLEKSFSEQTQDINSDSIFTRLHKELSHEVYSDLTSMYIYSSLFSLYRVLSSLKEWAHTVTVSDEFTTHIKSLAPHLTNICLSGSHDFRVRFTTQRLCVFVYWLCIFIVISIILRALAPQLSYCNIHDHRTLLSAVIQGIFQQLILHNLETFPLLNNLEDNQHDMIKLYNLCLTDCNVTEIDIITWILTVQLHIFIYGMRELHNNAEDVGHSTLTIRINNIAFNSIFYSSGTCPLAIFLMLLSSWDFMSLGANNTVGLTGSCGQVTYISSVLNACSNRYNGTLSILNTFYIIIHVIKAINIDHFNEHDITCLQNVLQNLLAQIDLCSEPCKSQLVAIDTALLEILTQLIILLQSTLLSDKHRKFSYNIDMTGRCISCILLFTQSIPNNYLSKTVEFCRDIPFIFMCMLSLYIDKYITTTKEICEAVTFVLSILNNDKYYVHSQNKNFTIYIMNRLLLETIVYIFTNYFDQLESTTTDTTDTDTINSMTIQSRVKHFIKYLLYVSAVSMVSVGEMNHSTVKQICCPDSLTEFSAKLFSNAYQFDLCVDQFLSIYITVLTKVLNAQGIVLTGFSFKKHPVDSTSLPSDSLVIELLFVVLVAVCTLPSDTCQSVMLLYLNQIISYIKFSTKSMDLVVSIYEQLRGLSTYISVYQYHVSLALFFLLISNGDIFKSSLLSISTQEMTSISNVITMDRDRVHSLDFYRIVTVFWIDVLQLLSTDYKIVGIDFSNYKVAIAERLPVSHEATSPLIIVELLTIYVSLNDLPYRKKLILYTFLATLYTRSKEESLEQICLIVPSLSSLIFFIVREVINLGLLLTLSLLENVLTVANNVSTWKDLTENLTEKMNCDIISFWIATVHLCELSESSVLLNAYPFVAELVWCCVTALGCSIDKPETFTKLHHLWASKTVSTLRDPFQFINGIIVKVESSLIRDSMTEYKEEHEPNIYNSLHCSCNSSNPWKEFSSNLSNFIFSSSTDSIDTNLSNFVRFIILKYFDYLTNSLKSLKIGKISTKTLALAFHTTSNLQMLTKVVEQIINSLDILRADVPVLIPRKLRQQLTKFSLLTRFCTAYTYFLVRGDDKITENQPNAHLRSPIAIPRFGNMLFYDFTLLREEEYYTVMFASMDKLEHKLNVSSFSVSTDSSLSYAYSDKEQQQKYNVIPQVYTLLQANTNIFTQLTPFHDKIMEIDLEHKTNPSPSSVEKNVDLINIDSNSSDMLLTSPKKKAVSLSSLRNKMRVNLIQEFLSTPLSLVGDISDDSFIIYPTEQGAKATDKQYEWSPKNAIQKLLAIESQLYNYLEISQPIELLNIHVPYTGQPYTEEQDTLQQFCQNHYNILTLILIFYEGLEITDQRSYNISTIISKRIALFTNACIGYFMKAYVETHPCPIDVTSRGLLYVVDFYVFNGVYRLTEISYMQKHYSMLFYLFSTRNIYVESLLDSINRIILLKYQFLIPLLAYWIHLSNNSSGTSVGRRRLRYLPCIQSLILIDVKLAESIFSYARGKGRTKITSFALSTFVKMLNYSYRIEAQLPTILKTLNFAFPAQLRLIEVQAVSKLKLLKSIIIGDDEELVALLFFKSGKLSPDLQSAIEDYESVDTLVTNGRAKIQKYSLPTHLKNTTLYYSPRCDMAIVKGLSLEELADKMHSLKYYNWCYRTIKKISCNGCSKDPNPHELSQLRYFQQVPPSSASHLLVASNYWKYRSAISYVCFCSSTEPFQEEISTILQRGRSIYGLYIPAIFIQTISFAFARAGHISIINSLTLEADKYALCSGQTSSKGENAQQQSQTPLTIDFTDEYTINSLAMWYCLVKFLLSRVSNIITDCPAGSQIGNISERFNHFNLKYSASDFSMPMFSAQKSLNTAPKTEFTQKLSQIMETDIAGEEEKCKFSNHNNDSKKNSKCFLPYNDAVSQYFEWVQIKERKCSYILVCSSLWQLVNITFAERGVIHIAVSRGDIPSHIFNVDAVRNNKSLEIAIDRYRSLFKAEHYSLKLALLHIYLAQKNLLWTASDTELAKSIVQGLHL